MACCITLSAARTPVPRPLAAAPATVTAPLRLRQSHTTTVLAVLWKRSRRCERIARPAGPVLRT